MLTNNSLSTMASIFGPYLDNSAMTSSDGLGQDLVLTAPCCPAEENCTNPIEAMECDDGSNCICYRDPNEMLNPININPGKKKTNPNLDLNP